MRKHLKDLGTRIWLTGKREFPQCPNRTPGSLDVAPAAITLAEMVMHQPSFSLRNLFYERLVDKLAKSLVTLHANHPRPQMRIAVPQDLDRFWRVPLSEGLPKPERSPQEPGPLGTSAAKPRDTAVTESVVARPDVLRLHFEPRL